MIDQAERRDNKFRFIKNHAKDCASQVGKEWVFGSKISKAESTALAPDLRMSPATNTAQETYHVVLLLFCHR